MLKQEEVESQKLNGKCEYKFSSGQSTRQLFLPTISRSNWNLKCQFLWKEEDRRIRRKILGARTRTNNKLNPHVTPGPGFGSQNRATVVRGQCPHLCSLWIAPLRLSASNTTGTTLSQTPTSSQPLQLSANISQAFPRLHYYRYYPHRHYYLHSYRGELI